MSVRREPGVYRIVEESKMKWVRPVGIGNIDTYYVEVSGPSIRGAFQVPSDIWQQYDDARQALHKATLRLDEAYAGAKREKQPGS